MPNNLGFGGNGVSFQTNRAIAELDRDYQPVQPVAPQGQPAPGQVGRTTIGNLPQLINMLKARGLDDQTIAAMIAANKQQLGLR